MVTKKKTLRLDEHGFPIVPDWEDRWREHLRIARMTDEEIDAALARPLPARWAHDAQLDSEP